MTGKEGIPRALYVTVKDRRIVVVRVFVKKLLAEKLNRL